MIRVICFLFAVTFVNFTNSFTRTDVYNWVKLYSQDFRGISIKPVGDDMEILWLEDIDAYTNPLNAYYNYVFEETGIRGIATVSNLCLEQEEPIQKDIKNFVLRRFANTTACPIKKGTRVIYKLPEVFTYNTGDPECGPIVGSFQLFKIRSEKEGITPLFLQMYLRGNATGSDC